VLCLKKIALPEAVFNLNRSALLVNALQNSDWEVLPEAMEDRLHQPYRIPFIPGIEDMFSQIKKTGLAGAALSGSGPSVVSLTKMGSEEIISKIMKDAFFTSRGSLSGLSVGGRFGGNEINSVERIACSI